MGTKISDLGAITPPLDGTEQMVAVDTNDATKKVTSAQLTAYVLDVVAWAAATTTPASGQLLFGFESDGTKKRLDLDATADYIGDYLANGVSAVTPLATDHVMLNDAGVLEKVLVSVLNTKMLDGTTDASATLKTSIRNISGEADRGGSLAGTEHMLVCVASDPQRATLTQVAAFVHAGIDTYLTGLDALTAGGTPIADGDRFYVSDAGTGKQMVASEVAAYVETKVAANITADVWDDATGAVTPGDGSVFVLENSGTRKTATGSALYSYIESELTSTDNTAVSASVLDAYKFLFFDGTDTKTATGEVLADYIETEIFEDATATSPATGADKILMDRSGVKTITADVLTTYIFTQDAETTTLQTSVLTIDALDSVTLDNSNYLLVQDGTPQQCTLLALVAYVHSGIAQYIGDQDDGAPVIGDDKFLIDRYDTALYIDAPDLVTYIQTGIWDQTVTTDPADADTMLLYRSGTGYLTAALTDLQDYMTEAIEAAALAAAVSGWNIVADGKYTITPASVSRITMSDTTGMAVGVPLRYTYGGQAYYGIVDAVSSNTYIDVRGATLDTGVDLANAAGLGLSYGIPSRTRTLRLEIPGAYLTPWCMPANDANADGANDSDITKTTMLADIARRYVDWRQGDAYLVAVSATHGTADGTVQSYINVSIGGTGNLVLDADGIQLGAAGTWVTSGLIEISESNYAIVEDQAIEVQCKALETADGLAGDVSLELVFVFE